jgi:hypothetical protein
MAVTREYLYDQKGPWPQPNTLQPRLFPAVVHLPLRERMQWNLVVGARYFLQTLVYTPAAFVYGLLRSSPKILSDQDFEERFNNTVFNKMILPFRPPDAAPPVSFGMDAVQASPTEQMPVQQAQQVFIERGYQLAARMAMDRFPEQMAEASHSSDDKTCFFIADFSIFEHLETFPGTYTAGTTALFRRTNPTSRLEVVSIRINGLNLTPADGEAWELAKLFTMQAATIRLVFSTHALLHFPEDSINAISKNCLPTDHVLFQLLIPHFDLQLVLDNTVQTSRFSPLLNRQFWPWTPHTGPVAGLVRTLEQLYCGVEDNPAYPSYHFKHPRRTPGEKYVNFLEAYYQTILRFVRKVLARIGPDDEIVRKWADYVAAHVPGFPNAANIFELQDEATGVRNLDWAVATIIWDVSVGHTTDHYNMGLLDINENPMRIRVPPPTSKDARLDRGKLRKWSDFFRYKMFWRLFLKSSTVYRLDKVRYGFTDAQLRGYNDEFLRDLQETAKSVAKDEFIPLREIARSVQF